MIIFPKRYNYTISTGDESVGSIHYNENGEIEENIGMISLITKDYLDIKEPFKISKEAFDRIIHNKTGYFETDIRFIEYFFESFFYKIDVNKTDTKYSSRFKFYPETKINIDGITYILNYLELKCSLSLNNYFIFELSINAQPKNKAPEILIYFGSNTQKKEYIIHDYKIRNQLNKDNFLYYFIEECLYFVDPSYDLNFIEKRYLKKNE